ncbi:ACP phosphodiesterase, partial [Vibrio breoganii]
MNFLAHLHIAQHCKSNLAGNLLGDFVKGDPNKHYSTSL